MGAGWVAAQEAALEVAEGEVREVAAEAGATAARGACWAGRAAEEAAAEGLVEPDWVTAAEAGWEAGVGVAAEPGSSAAVEAGQAVAEVAAVAADLAATHLEAAIVPAAACCCSPPLGHRAVMQKPQAEAHPAEPGLPAGSRHVDRKTRAGAAAVCPTSRCLAAALKRLARPAKAVMRLVPLGAAPMRWLGRQEAVSCRMVSLAVTL